LAQNVSNVAKCIIWHTERQLFRRSDLAASHELVQIIAVEDSVSIKPRCEPGVRHEEMRKAREASGRRIISRMPRSYTNLI
jgi:hypothetical protein